MRGGCGVRRTEAGVPGITPKRLEESVRRALLEPDGGAPLSHDMRGVDPVRETECPAALGSGLRWNDGSGAATAWGVWFSLVGLARWVVPRVEPKGV